MNFKQDLGTIKVFIYGDHEEAGCQYIQINWGIYIDAREYGIKGMTNNVDFIAATLIIDGEEIKVSSSLGGWKVDYPSYFEGQKFFRECQIELEEKTFTLT